MRIAPWIAVLVVGACKAPGGDETDDTDVPDLTGDTGASWSVEESFTAPPAAIDVLFVVDTVPNNEATYLEMVGSLLAGLESHGGPWRAGLVPAGRDLLAPGALLGPVIDGSTADPGQAFAEQFADTNVSQSTERPFDATWLALTEPLLSGANAGFRRADARLAVVFHNREDDQSEVDPTVFAEWLLGLAADPAMATFSGLVGPPTAPPCFDPATGRDADPAPRVHSVITATGGVYGDYCSQNWGPFATAVSDLAAGAAEVYVLAGDPDPSRLQVSVDGNPVNGAQTDGFTWDADRHAVVLHGAAIPAVGSPVVVRY